MGFFDKYPYTDFHELNLDWILESIKKLSDAAGIVYDDSVSQIGAENVQEAIEALNEKIIKIADATSNFILLDNALPASVWQNGQSFTHIQTVNNQFLMDIINAMKDNRYLVIRFTNVQGTITEEELFVQIYRENDSLNYTDKIQLMNLVTRDVIELVINGINDDANVYADVSPLGHLDLNANEIVYDNSGSGMSATNVQDAIDEVKGDIPADASDVPYDNTNTGLVATDVQAAIDELKTLIPGDASEVSYDNTLSGLTADNVQAAIDELKAAIPEDAVDISYDNTVSGLTATNLQAAVDEIVNLVLSSGVASFNGRTGAVLPAASDYSASQIAAGTFLGKTNANATAEAVLTDSQLRDIEASTTDLTPGTSTLTAGKIYLVYEI